MGYDNLSAAFIPLSSALPLEFVLDLEIGQFSESDVTNTQWTTIFQRCKAMKRLRLRDEASLSLFEGFVKAPHLAPKLQAIDLKECTVIELEFRDFYPIKDVHIENCAITKEAVARLEQCTNIIWDGVDPDDLGEDSEDSEDFDFDFDNFVDLIKR
ncbi:hypothetical protein BDN71DRAFT_1445481 [Pleurotus eryngii]|uniref:Uncharacterized protein n=1 Tax=Pleurotus eryngii TaxID=5323 RepID=A0A9P6A4H5_PLEER|nr:hypothetical protein BDN71DRAFT_1445481 [Pleurotus eryngii]